MRGAERMSEAAVRAEVAQHVDDWADYDWWFHPRFPVSKFRSLRDGTGPRDDSPAGWARWYERERDGDDNWGNWGLDFEHWWSSGGSFDGDTPVVAVQQGDGFGVADGNHRVGVSHLYKMRTAPAYVGVRRGGAPRRRR